MGVAGGNTGFKVYLGPYTVYADSLWACGYNSYGELGNGTTISYSSPIQIGSLTNWNQISHSSNYSTFGIKTDGTLWAWGLNNYAQLGNGTTDNYSSPIQIGSLTNWSNVNCSGYHTSAIKTDGTLWTWGLGQFGELGNGTTTNYSSPIQIGALTNWSIVKLGSYYTMAVKTDGTLWTFGRNNGGQLGNNTITDYSSPIQIGSLTNWSSISAGAESSHAIKTDGTLWSWGGNGQGQLGNETTINYSSPIQVGSLTNWSQISSSGNHIASIKTDGTLWTCGYNTHGQLGNGTTIKYSSPIQIGALTTWSKIAAAKHSTIATKTDGTLWSWGRNHRGQLGNGTTINYSSPIQIGSLTNWSKIYCDGGFGVFAIPSPTRTYDIQQDLGQRYVSKDYLLDVYPNIASATGARKSPGLWAWGQNGAGTLGIGNTTYYSSPIQVGSLTNWKQVSVGGSTVSPGGFHTLAVKTDGTLWAWGANFQYTNGFGQLGNGTTVSYSSPIQIGALNNWKQVSAATGGAFSAAIKNNGTLWTWGNNADFQGINPVGNLGNGTTIPYSSPIQIGLLTNWKQVDCGANFMAATKTDGTLWAWGNGNNGQLGNGTLSSYSSPIQIGSLTNWKKVVTSRSYTIAVKTDGTLWGWGYNSQGQLGNGTDVQYSSPIQIGSLTNWKDVSVGESHVLATKNDGTLWGWGSNVYGQLGYILYDFVPSGSFLSPTQVVSSSNWATTDTDTNVVVYTGSQSRNSFFITSAGALYAWGGNSEGQLGNGTTINYSSPIQIGSLTNWKQIVNGYTVHAIKTDGTLWAWGAQTAGTFGNGTSNSSLQYSSPIQVGSLTNWNQVSGGIYYAMAVKTDGTLWGWGYNAYGMIGNNNRISYSSPVQIGALTNWKQVSTTGYHTMAVKTDGTLWGWGQNYIYGSLGNGTTNDYSSPIQIGSLTNWKQVACGQDFTLAVKTDGTLWAWGDNSSYGRLGNGSTVKYSSPIQIGSLTNWKYVSINGGAIGVNAIKTDGTLWAWGGNPQGQLGNGNSINYSSPIQVGSLNSWVQVFSSAERATIAAKSDGTLWAWGGGGQGVLGVQGFFPASTKSPVQIGLMTNWKFVDCGENNSYMIKTDGTLWTCGYAKNGLGVGNTITYSSPVQIGSLSSWKQVSATVDSVVAIADGYY